MDPKLNKNDRYRTWIRYTSLTAQIITTLGIAVFGGLKLDQRLHSSPLLIIVLPLLALAGIFFELYRETTRMKKDHDVK